MEIKKLFSKFIKILRVIRKIKNWPTWFLNYFGFVKSGPIVYYFRNGQKIKVRAGENDKILLKETFIDNCYIPQGFKIKKGDVVVDIGAHIGIFSVFASKFASKIYSFEPWSENFKALKENIALNNIENIIVPFNSAVSDKTGKREFFICSDNSGGHSFYPSEVYHMDKKIIVPNVSFEDFVVSNNISVIDFLKMDCEGGEYDILLKCPIRVLNIVQKISMEYHNIDVGKNVSLLSNFLEKNGFVVSINDKDNNNYLYAKR